MVRIGQNQRIVMIGIVALFLLLYASCGGSDSVDKTIKKVSPKASTKKPAPVFTPVAEITTADGKIFQVADFAFYSEHKPMYSGGTVYIPTSGQKNWDLYLKQGPIWKQIDFADLKSLTFSQGSRGWLNMNLTLLDGSTFSGQHPKSAYGNVWFRRGGMYLIGSLVVKDRITRFEFKWFVGDVKSIERGEEKTAGRDQKKIPRFKIIYRDKLKLKDVEATLINPRVQIKWIKEVEKYLADITIIKATINNTEVSIKLHEIDYVDVPRLRSKPFTVKLKSGVTIKTMLPPRIFGRLKNGDILFTYMTGYEKIIKKIKIL